MSKKLIGAQKPFTMLVANLRQGSDPSRGPSGNPQKIRSTYRVQLFPEIPGRGPETLTSGPTPGVGTRGGLLTFTVPGVPVPASGTITVSGNSFSGPTTVQLGSYTLTTGYDFQVGASVQATAELTVTLSPSTATVTVGGVALTPSIGARTPGNNDYDSTLLTPELIAAEIQAAINDAANSFAAISVASAVVGAVVSLEAVPVGSLGNAVTLTTTNGTITVSGATFTGGVDSTESTADNLSMALDALPEFTAVAAGDVVTVEGPVGPGGNSVVFTSGGSNPYNFTFDPPDGTMSGAEPFIGPPEIT